MESAEIYAPQWFVIQTRFQKEKTANENLMNQAIPTLYPRKEVVISRQRTVARPFFPRYLFAQFPLDSLSKVRHTRGVSRVVEFEPGQPLAVEPWIIEEIAAHMNPDGVMLGHKIIRDNTAFIPNEPIIVTGGAFINQTGLFVSERNGVVVAKIGPAGFITKLERHWVSKICYN
jgi:transcription antitermination factor NusG